MALALALVLLALSGEGESINRRTTGATAFGRKTLLWSGDGGLPNSELADFVLGLPPPATDEKPRPPAEVGPFGCRSTNGGVPRPLFDRSRTASVLALGRNPVETAGCL